MLKLAGGPFYERIFSVQAYGGEGSLSIGSASRETAWDFSFHGAHGETFHGLTFSGWRVEFIYEWILASENRVRFGFGPSFGGMTIDRATTPPPGETVTPNTLTQGFLGVEGHASVDVVQLDGGSGLYVSAVLKTEALTVWGPLLLLGFRFEPTTSRGTPATRAGD